MIPINYTIAQQIQLCVCHGGAGRGYVTYDRPIMLNQAQEGCYHNRIVSNDLHYLGVKANTILPCVQAPGPAVCLYQAIRLLGPP